MFLCWLQSVSLSYFTMKSFHINFYWSWVFLFMRVLTLSYWSCLFVCIPLQTGYKLGEGRSHVCLVHCGVPGSSQSSQWTCHIWLSWIDPCSVQTLLHLFMYLTRLVLTSPSIKWKFSVKWLAHGATDSASGLDHYTLCLHRAWIFSKVPQPEMFSLSLMGKGISMNFFQIQVYIPLLHATFLKCPKWTLWLESS